MKEQLHSFMRSYAMPLGLKLKDPALRGRLQVLLLAAVVSVLLFQFLSPQFDTLEERVGAIGWTLRPTTIPEERLIIVSIDEKSIAEVGPWPWSREQMATLVTAIDDAGAQLQLHDIVYSEARAGDNLFLESLLSADKAVIAQAPQLQSGQSLAAGALTHPVNGVVCGAATGRTQLPFTSDYLAPDSQFAAISKGHITPIVASDGAIRKVPALVCVNGNAYPALALTALLEATDNSSWNAKLLTGSSLFGPALELQFDAFPGMTVPLDSSGSLRISFANSPDVFQAISAVDVMTGAVDLSLLNNAWVLVGATAFGMDDIVPTPYAGATPGVELTARLIVSLLDGSVPYTPQSANWVLSAIALLFGAILYALAATRGRYAAYGLPLAAISMPFIAIAIHMQLLSSANIWLGWLFPTVFGVLAASFLLLLELRRVRLERSRVYGNLSSYLPSDIAREIAYQLPSSSVNAKRINATLLNADLRNFSAFSEARPPEESAAVLHFFFTRATEIVERNGGRVHEFRGDGLLAVWDGHDAQAAEQALASARALHEALHHSLLPTNTPVDLEPLDLGIGIEQGPVLIGSIGPAHRRSHALLGDTVTITLRIQELTADLAQPILIGECAARQLGNYNLESQGSYLLAGLKIPHVLFALPPVVIKEQPNKQKQPLLKILVGGRR